MEKEMLESYISMKEEIKELQYKLEHLAEDESLAGNSVINDYRTGFPRPQSIVGNDMDKYRRLKERYTKKIEKLQKDCAEVEEFIEDIPDSLTRRIFRIVFVEGKTQKEVGKLTNIERSTISKRINNYLHKDT